MNHRMDSGFAYFQKNKEKMKVVMYDKEEIQVECPGSGAKVGEKKEYLVSNSEGFWRCDCDDYNYRRSNDEFGASFNCKHIEAVHFLIAAMKTEGQQELKVV